MTEETDRTSGPYTAGFASFTASVRSEEDIFDEEKWHGVVDMTLSLRGENIEVPLTVELARDMIDALTRAVAIAEEMASEMQAESGAVPNEELGNAC